MHERAEPTVREVLHPIRSGPVPQAGMALLLVLLVLKPQSNSFGSNLCVSARNVLATVVSYKKQSRASTPVAQTTTRLVLTNFYMTCNGRHLCFVYGVLTVEMNPSRAFVVSTTSFDRVREEQRFLTN